MITRQTRKFFFFLEHTNCRIIFFRLEKTNKQIYYLSLFVVLFCEAVSDVRKQGNNEAKYNWSKKNRDQLAYVSGDSQYHKLKSIVYFKNNMNSRRFFHTSKHFQMLLLIFHFFITWGKLHIVEQQNPNISIQLIKTT